MKRSAEESEESSSSIVDKVVQELTSGDEPTIIQAYQILHSFSLDRKQWDRVLSKSTVSSLQNHLQYSSDPVKRECVEALVSVASSEYACRRLYAFQLMPLLQNIFAQSACPIVRTGVVNLMSSFVECVGEPAASQVPLQVYTSEYEQMEPRVRFALAELFEVCSEDGPVENLPTVSTLDFSFKDNTMAQLCLFMAHLNSSNQVPVICKAMVDYIDESRKCEEKENVLQCLDKVYRILANLFQSVSDPSQVASRHLESILAQEVLRMISTAVSPSAMNALANYLTLNPSCGLPQDIVDQLKQETIKLFKNEDLNIKQSASNLLRAMSMVCDFSLSAQEELAIYTLDDGPAANCAAIAFFCPQSKERDAFILRQLQSSECVETVCEFVEAAMSYDIHLSRALLKSALLRFEKAGDERVNELMRLL